MPPQEQGQPGLAQAMAQGQPPQSGGGGMPTMEQVIQLLMQGISPEELVQAGVPKEMVVQAIQIIQQQMQQQEGQAPQDAAPMSGSMSEGGNGLASRMAGG